MKRIHCQNFDRSIKKHWKRRKHSIAAVNEIILVFPQFYCYGSWCQFQYYQCRSYRVIQVCYQVRGLLTCSCFALRRCTLQSATGTSLLRSSSGIHWINTCISCPVRSANKINRYLSQRARDSVSISDKFLSFLWHRFHVALQINSPADRIHIFLQVKFILWVYFIIFTAILYNDEPYWRSFLKNFVQEMFWLILQTSIIATIISTNCHIRYYSMYVCMYIKLFSINLHILNI